MPSVTRHVPRWPAALAAAAAVVLAGCQVATTVEVVVAEDGSGTVAVSARFDAEAADHLGDPATELALDDLAATGWRVEDPGTTDDGGLVVAASKRFGSPEGLAEVLGGLGGDGSDGRPPLFSDVTLTPDSGFASRRWTFSADLTLTGSLDQFGDDELTGELDGLPLGRSPEELAADVADGAFPLTVRVALPWPVEEDATDGDAAAFPAEAVEWTAAVPGPPVAEHLDAAAETRDEGPYRWFALAGAAVVGVAAAWVVGRLVAARR